MREKIKRKKERTKNKYLEVKPLRPLHQAVNNCIKTDELKLQSSTSSQYCVNRVDSNSDHGLVTECAYLNNRNYVTQEGIAKLH